MASGSQKFQDVLRLINSPGDAKYTAYLQGIRAVGHMDCPAPPWDVDGTYRLIALADVITVQRLGSSGWESAPLEPPKSAAAAVQPETPPGLSTKTRTILFMDVAGWSHLSAHEIHAYATRALPDLARTLSDHDFVNTWGDAIVATFDSVKLAAENALRIRDFFLHSYPEHGISSGLTCRISLHLGEVIWCDNALRQGRDIFGHAVHVAARLEPVTVPGHVFCTSAVADRLAEVVGSAPRAWSLGEVALAKRFGTIDAYIVTGPNSPDPRPSLAAPLAGTADAPQPLPMASPAVPDDSARVRLRGWVNKLLTSRSGEAIPLAEIETACKVSPGQPFRLLPEIVTGGTGAWNIDALTQDDVILKYVSPKPVFSRPPRGY
jgi:class 3 adenylate cyclase